MKLVAVVLSLVVGSFAHADGFNCQSASGLNVKIYNHTSPEVGTRVPAVMIISDSSIQAGRKTIARFADANGVLKNDGSHSYVGKVDLRFNDSGRKGELLAGTKLGHVAAIRMDIGFSYAAPVAEGTEVTAILSVAKRDGTAVAEPATCIRYLKN